MDRKPVAYSATRPQVVDVVHVQPRVDALGEEVERQGHDIHVAGALAVAKERPSTRSAPASWASSAAATAVPRSLCGWTLRTIESRLGCGGRTFDDVGVRVRPIHLDRVGQVDDHPAIGATARARP